MRNEMNSLEEKIKWQVPASLLTDKKWDVAIIGAGPAGAIAAVHLAAKNHQVLLFDKKKFPREKVCGDGLLQDALNCLDNAGLGPSVRESGHLVQNATIFSPSRKEVDIDGTFLMIKRHILDTLIAKRAVELGADFSCGEVDRVYVKPDQSVCLSSSESNRIYRARVGIFATGANLRLLKRTGWQAPPPIHTISLRCYAQSSVKLDRIIISYDKSIVPGYAWIFPMGNHEYNLGCGVSHKRTTTKSINLKKVFNAFITEFPLARELMQHCTHTTPLMGAGLRCGFEGVNPYTNGPLLAIGETIGTTLPFTGEGIGKAMETGQLAAEFVHQALVTDDLEKLKGYDRWLRNEFKPKYKSYLSAENWLSNPLINDFLLARMGKSKRSLRILSGILSEANDPRELFSSKGILLMLSGRKR